MPQMPFFALAALLPFGLLCLAATLGGAWVWAAFLYMGGLTALLSAVVAPVAALFAFVDPGLAKDANCGALIAEAR